MMLRKSVMCRTIMLFVKSGNNDSVYVVFVYNKRYVLKSCF